MDPGKLFPKHCGLDLKSKDYSSPDGLCSILVALKNKSAYGHYEDLFSIEHHRLTGNISQLY